MEKKNLNGCKRIKQLWTQGVFLHKGVPKFDRGNRVVVEVSEHSKLKSKSEIIEHLLKKSRKKRTKMKFL